MNRSTLQSFRIPSLLLAAALQVMPLVRAALPVAQSASQIIVILFRWGAGTAAALGGVQAVSGGSTVITNPLTSTATNGTPYSLRLTTAPDQAHYWTASPMPAGLSLTGVSGATLWKIEGIPTVSGKFNILLTAKDQMNSGPDRTVTATLALNIISLTPTPPSIVSQPANKTVAVGSNATFTVSASGSAPLVYQWQFNGGDLAGKTNSTLTLTGVTTNDEGSYAVIITNLVGSVTSAPASLTVQIPPSITQAPTNQTVLAGGSATFTVTAAGSAPLSYRWRKGGTNIAGATSSTYTIPSTQASDAGAYSVLVSNAVGTATSSAAALTVNVPPSFTTQPANQSAEVGMLATFTSVVAGTAPLAYQWFFTGSPIGPGTNASLTLAAVTTNDAGAYQLVVTNLAGSATSIVATLTATPSTDTNRPTVTVTAPSAASTLVYANSARLSGTAKDNRSVASVQILRGAQPPVIATGTSNWWADVPLEPGTNLCQVIAYDSAGNSSTASARTFLFVVRSPLALFTHGSGKVAGATNGQWLDLGRSYSLTATPGAGNVFSNWTGDLSSSAASLTFTMQSNLTLHANFITNPFVVAKGAFNGLFHETNQVQHDRSGLFTAAVADSGAFTATLQIGKSKTRFTGQFGLTGLATNVVARANASPLTVELALGLNGTDQITGRVTGDTWTAPLLADRAVFNAASHPAYSYTNHYTVIFPGEPTNAAAVPGGDGYGTVLVDAGGRLTFAGVLGDGTKASQKVPLSKQGAWPLYLPLYGGKGSALGWLTISNGPSDDLTGLISWTRPAGPAPKNYTNGFLSELMARGSVYPALAPGALVFATTNLLVAFEGGNLAVPFTNAVTLAPANKVSNASTNKLALTLTPKSGLFKGSVTPPGATAARPFAGVLLNHHGYGAGFFLGTNSSGRVYFGP